MSCRTKRCRRGERPSGERRRHTQRRQGRHRTGKSGIMNEKCSFSPRVQVVRPNATITTSSKDPILHTTNAMTEGRQEPVQRGGAGAWYQDHEAVEHASRTRAAHLQHTPVDARLHHRQRRYGCGHRYGWKFTLVERAARNVRVAHLARVAQRGGAEGYGWRITVDGGHVRAEVIAGRAIHLRAH